MKKYLSVVLSVMAAFLLSACGGGGSSSSGDTSTSTATTTTDAVTLVNTQEIVFADTAMSITDAQASLPENLDLAAATDKMFTLTVNYRKNLNDNYQVSVNTSAIDIDGCTVSNATFSPNPLVMNGNSNTIASQTVKGYVNADCTNTKNYTLKAKVTTKLGDKTSVEEFTASTGASTGTPSDTPDTGYAFYNVTTPIVVSQPSASYEIKAQVLKNGFILPDQKVTLRPFLSKYGSVSGFTVTSAEDGYAIFSYTAPAVLPANGTSTTLQMLMYDDANNTVTANVELQFNTSGGGGVTSPYTLVNPSSPIEITAGNQNAVISVYVVDASTNVGVSGKTVTITTPALGSVDAASVTTDSAGKAQFNYTAPSTISAGTITLYARLTENGSVSEQPIVINFNPGSGGDIQYSLTNVATPIEVNYNEEIKTISAVVVDANGVGVKDVDVSITAVPDVKYGAIISASTVKTDQSGRAIFSYKAPTDIAVVNDENTSVKVFINNDIATAKTVMIRFSKVDENTTIPLVVISNTYKELNLTQNSQNVEIEVQVFEQGTNIPYTQGNVKVTLPDNVLDGVDVGSFTAYTVPVGTNGKAVFNYTGPQDIKALIDANETSATFKFFHEANPTQSESVVVQYDLQAGYIPANYLLTTSSSDGKQTMNLDVLKTFTLYLKDDQGTLIDHADINTITITSQNERIGKIIDAVNGTEVTTLTFTGADAVNSKSFSIQSYTLSGLLPVKIRVDFTDANGNADFRETTMNIVVLSGPPTAMSISYAGVEQNATAAKYTEKFVVTVTDAYNNPVNTRPYVATGAIVEYAVDGSSATGDRTTTSPRLWHGTSDSRGTLEAIGGNKAQFTTTTDTFNYVDINNDRLVVFGAGFVYEALGKWDIASVSNRLLGLKDDYYGITRDDLGFAVGHNNRQDLCSSDQREYVGNMKSNTYQIDENGHALIEFEYDYQLTGKDIMVWVNLTGFQADDNQTGRIGEAQKHTLRGNGLIPVPEGGYSVPKGTTQSGAIFQIHHENAPEWYTNGKFGWRVKAGSTCAYTVDDVSNLYDARSCYGAAYITFTLTAPADKDCTFAIEGINVSEEFSGVNSH